MVPAPVCAAQDTVVPVSSRHPSLAPCTLRWKGRVGTCSFLTALLGGGSLWQRGCAGDRGQQLLLQQDLPGLVVRSSWGMVLAW